MIDQRRAFDHLERLSKEYDYLILLSYSISSTLFEKLLNTGKLKDFRLMYSVMTKARNPLRHLQKYKDKIKQIETDFNLDRYERSHAKIYLFAKHVGKRVELRAVIGSFNLSFQGSVELYGDYRGEFSEKSQVGSFTNLFEKPPDTEHLNEIFSGDRAVLSALSLLLTHWHNKDLFIQFDDKRFVTTFRDNSLKISLIRAIEEAIQAGKKSDESLDILVVSPFHSFEAIENFLDEIKRAMERLGCEIPYQVRLLTNGFHFTLKGEDEAFTDPSRLKKLAEDHPFSIRFWGTPNDEPIDHGNRLHLKLFTLNVGNVHNALMTSANLTKTGLGYGPKNLEVGIWEWNTCEAQRIFETINELWSAEVIPNEEIWKSLEKWYSGYKILEEIPGFSISDLADRMHIEDKIILEVKTDKEVTIKGILSFLTVPAEKLVFRKEKSIHKTSFVLKRSHVGKMDLDLYAKTKDGEYYRIKHKRVEVIEKFPNIEVKDVLNKKDGLLNIRLEIERGRAYEELHATEFKLEKSEPFAIKRKTTKTEKFIEFILPIKPVRITYRNEWNQEFDVKPEQKSSIYTKLHQTKSVCILTDKKTICPKKPIVLKLEFNRPILEKLGLKNIQAVRKAEYYDYFSSAKSEKRKKDTLKLDNQIELNNEFQISSRAENVSCQLYATNHLSDFLIPMGNVDYEIFKNPPEITHKYNPIRTNITPLTTNFVLKEDREIDVVDLKYGFGNYKNKIEIQRKNEPLKLDVLRKARKGELKKGLFYEARFKFLFNIADKIVKDQLDFHLYVYFPNMRSREVLIWNNKDPTNTIRKNPFHSIEIAWFTKSVPKVHLQRNNKILKLPLIDGSIRVPVPKPILTLFNRKLDIERHKNAQLVFSMGNTGEISVDLAFNYLTIEKEHYIPNTGGLCTDVIIVGPEPSAFKTSRTNEINEIARSVFLKNLTINVSDLNSANHKKRFDSLIQKLARGEYVPKYTSEMKQKPRRFGAPSKVARIADIIIVNYVLNREWHITVK